MHILIVEDGTKIAGFLATGLNESGYQTTQLGNGLHALSVLEQQQIDLVLLDVMLPTWTASKSSNFAYFL